MPEDIAKIVDEAFEDMDTLEWEPPQEVWHMLGADAEDMSPEEEAQLVSEALGTVSTKELWYEKLFRELGE